ncbi:MAG: hypothetical protein M5U34_38100 [Chloroflexi bacterium]|nr:hypothetical protein [Chloroflexota bacterium]
MGKKELIKLLENRLRWASDDSYKSLASLSEELLDLDEKLANLAFKTSRNIWRSAFLAQAG